MDSTAEFLQCQVAAYSCGPVVPPATYSSTHQELTMPVEAEGLREADIFGTFVFLFSPVSDSAIS